jgi:hypothetical protein
VSVNPTKRNLPFRLMLRPDLHTVRKL